jgi:hypothetical protein
MPLLTAKQVTHLRSNGARQVRHLGGPGRLNLKPVVKLFLPDTTATWLLTEIDPQDDDKAFGLCDLGLGGPELGWVSLKGLRRLRGWLGLRVECDASFRAVGPISDYLGEARRVGRIIT